MTGTSTAETIRRALSTISAPESRPDVGAADQRRRRPEAGHVDGVEAGLLDQPGRSARRRRRGRPVARTGRTAPAAGPRCASGQLSRSATPASSCMQSRGIYARTGGHYWDRTALGLHTICRGSVTGDTVSDVGRAGAARAARTDPGRASSRPGARLGEVELADRLGVSRTPVREALTRLAAEGIVEIAGQPGRPRRHLDRRRARGRLRPALHPRAAAHRLRRPERRPPPTSQSSTTSRTGCSRSAAPAPSQDLDALVPLNRAFHDRLSPSPTTPRSPPRWPPRSTRRSCCATSTPTTRRRCAAASPTTSRSSPPSAPATPTWARAVMTAHIHNARAVMVRAATASDRYSSLGSRSTRNEEAS